MWLKGAEELELELIQPHMAQKQMLRGEVGCACVAREVWLKGAEEGCRRLFTHRLKGAEGGRKGPNGAQGE